MNWCVHFVCTVLGFIAGIINTYNFLKNTIRPSPTNNSPLMYSLLGGVFFYTAPHNEH